MLPNGIPMDSGWPPPESGAPVQPDRAIPTLTLPELSSLVFSCQYPRCDSIKGRLLGGLGWVPPTASPGLPGRVVGVKARASRDRHARLVRPGRRDSLAVRGTRVPRMPSAFSSYGGVRTIPSEPGCVNPVRPRTRFTARSAPPTHHSREPGRHAPARALLRSVSICGSFLPCFNPLRLLCGSAVNPINRYAGAPRQGADSLRSARNLHKKYPAW